MIGFGLGGGSQGVEDLDEREGGPTGNFRIGYAVQPTLVLQLESLAWFKSQENEIVGFEPFSGDPIIGDITFTFSTTVAALTYYPPSSGLFLRGGVGVGMAEIEIEALGVTISDDETGLGLLGALGYEWRLTRKFALAPEIDFTYQSLDEIGSTNMIGGSLGLNWYW